jgi:dihydrofolate synthase/folylpolyglutamate synthase
VIEYSDRHGELVLPLPTLPGTHQAENAALAVAILRHQDQVTVSPEALAEGLRAAHWPARLQHLSGGPLTRHAGAREVWLDGGHNPDAGLAIARHFTGQRLHLVIGMLANKDPRALTAPLEQSIASIRAVPVPGHDCHGPASFGPAARAADSVADALADLPNDGLPVLIAGSLYLAGVVLKANDEVPD